MLICILFVCSVVEGTRHDDDCARDPMDEVLSILAGTEDVPLVRRYGLWVVRRDWERGLQVSLALFFISLHPLFFVLCLTC
jgi:hypothetical protein